MHRETGLRTFADEVVGDDLGRNARLERIHASIDWDRIGGIVAGLHLSREGRKAYPPLVMLKAMLLQHLHDLGDPKLEERLRNDLSWRRFTGLGLSDGTPDHSTISRFRNLMVERGLMRRVFEAVNEQLDEGGLVLRRGTVVDATLVEARASRPRRRTGDGRAAPSSPADPDATWGRRTFGYKGHLAIDHGSWLVRDALLTPAHVNDTQMCDALIQGDEEVLYADAAYETERRAGLLEEMGIGNAVMHRANKHHPVLPPEKRARNAEISKRRMPAEGVFGYFKRTLGYRKVRYAGLARGETELLLKSTVYNIVRALKLTHAPARA
jgi:IS5 family transposase